MGTRPTLISTFSGCGGSSLGYKWAGYNEILAIDFEKNSVDTFRLNFPEVPVWQRDITTVKAEEILEFCKMKKTELDLLDGSPPCQGFSTAGKRAVNDGRNRLFENFIYLTRELQPKVFLMENVSGLIKGEMKGIFIEIMNAMKNLNYDVKCKLMNSVNYGVPQSRQRLIWIGVRKDLGIRPSFPVPINKIVTVKQALIDCPAGIYYKPKDDTVIRNYITVIKQGETGADYHPKGNFFNLRRLILDKPSYTLPKNAGRNIIHPTRNRFITDREAARLSSFPDDFQFVGSAIDRISRIGNAVMPRFMYHVAKHIRENILDKSRI